VSVALPSVTTMPSYLHEILIEMFRERPTLAAELLRGSLDVAVPDFREAHLSSAELTDVAPTEYRADMVITLDRDDGPVLGIVVEVQLRIDVRKRRTWPAYVATLHARLGCPVVLLVVCPDRAVAEWSAIPIVVGRPGLVLTPVVLGPNQVPVVTGPAAGRRLPELAVLSAMAHGARPEPQPIFEALLAGLDVLDPEHADLYTGLVLAVLPAAARTSLEEFMSIVTRREEFQQEFARVHFSQGQALGEAQALLAILEARGIEVSDEMRETITTCTDLDQLDRWIRRAATAEKIQDVVD